MPACSTWWRWPTGSAPNSTGLSPLVPPADDRPRWPDDDAERWSSLEGCTVAERVAIEFAAQFSLDVSAISDDLRGRLLEAHG